MPRKPSSLTTPKTNKRLLLKHRADDVCYVFEWSGPPEADETFGEAWDWADKRLAPRRQPATPKDARAWLKWAAESHHTEGCACRGCIKAREMLRDRL